MLLIRHNNFAEFRLATLESEAGHYLDLTSLMALIDDPNRTNLWAIVRDNQERFEKATGSSHNHQAWVGGYLDHVSEVMNLACQLYNTLNALRKLPFELQEALEVMFLHDIEKPFKEGGVLIDPDGNKVEATKANRKALRRNMIDKYGVRLTEEQDNALEYVEGVPDSKYTPGERTMGELAAFCHSCDILSARLWWDRGHCVPAPKWGY
jgi:hypothetical protein